MSRIRSYPPPGQSGLDPPSIAWWIRQRPKIAWCLPGRHQAVGGGAWFRPGRPRGWRPAHRRRQDWSWPWHRRRLATPSEHDLSLVPDWIPPPDTAGQGPTRVLLAAPLPAAAGTLVVVARSTGRRYVGERSRAETRFPWSCSTRSVPLQRGPSRARWHRPVPATSHSCEDSGARCAVDVHRQSDAWKHVQTPIYRGFRVLPWTCLTRQILADCIKYTLPKRVLSRAIRSISTALFHVFPPASDRFRVFDQLIRCWTALAKAGAGDGNRTRNVNLGKVAFCR